VLTSSNDENHRWRPCCVVVGTPDDPHVIEYTRTEIKLPRKQSVKQVSSKASVEGAAGSDVGNVADFEMPVVPEVEEPEEPDEQLIEGVQQQHVPDVEGVEQPIVEGVEEKHVPHAQETIEFQHRFFEPSVAESLRLSAEKNSHIEGRLMRANYEVHEVVRHLLNLLSGYKDSLSHPSWFCNIICRELGFFETAHRCMRH